VCMRVLPLLLLPLDPALRAELTGPRFNHHRPLHRQASFKTTLD